MRGPPYFPEILWILAFAALAAIGIALIQGVIRSVYPRMKRGMHIRLIANLVGFQAVWLSSVVGAAHGMPWMGLIVVFLYLPLHLRLSPHVRADLILLVLFGVAGTLVDSIYTMAELVRYQGAMVDGWMAPPWISALWLGFGLSLTGSLAWLSLHPVLSAVACGVAGTTAYAIGVAAGSAELLTDALTGYGVIAAVWVGVGLGVAFAVPRLIGNLAKPPV